MTTRLATRGASDRRRRVRGAVEASLLGMVLLGTEEQVRLAVAAARDMTEVAPLETGALVVSLSTFIRDVLDLDPIPFDVSVPRQGPTRPRSAGGQRVAGAERGRGAGGRGGLAAAAREQLPSPSRRCRAGLSDAHDGGAHRE